jgi:hypothetical protein
MMNYVFGDILIINFAFTNGSTSKRRPVMVIKDTAVGDILVAKIKIKTYSTPYDCLIKEWSYANLLNESIVRVHKIQTIHSSLVFGKIGTLSNPDKKDVRHALIELLIKL